MYADAAGPLQPPGEPAFAGALAASLVHRHRQRSSARAKPGEAPCAGAVSGWCRTVQHRNEAGASAPANEERFADDP